MLLPPLCALSQRHRKSLRADPICGKVSFIDGCGFGFRDPVCCHLPAGLLDALRIQMSLEYSQSAPAQTQTVHALVLVGFPCAKPAGVMPTHDHTRIPGRPGHQNVVDGEAQFRKQAPESAEPSPKAVDGPSGSSERMLAGKVVPDVGATLGHQGLNRALTELVKRPPGLPFGYPVIHCSSIRPLVPRRRVTKCLVAAKAAVPAWRRHVRWGSWPRAVAVMAAAFVSAAASRRSGGHWARRYRTQTRLISSAW